VLGRPSDEEALRVVVAFCCIMEPAKRAEILRLAELFATQSQAVDGYTHFSLLTRDGQVSCDIPSQLTANRPGGFGETDDPS
jgi:hypothetical protein